MNKKIIDKDFLLDLYIHKNMSIKEISKLINSGNSVVARNLKEYGLIRTNGEVHAKHGMSSTRQYKIWQQMKVRCDNPKSIHFLNYGGKGITYCDKWKTFKGFWEDMCYGYTDGLTLDRLDFNKNYNKNNCRWATYTEQNNNKSDNIITKISVKELIKLTGLSSNCIYQRLRKGWSIETIINTPKLSNNGREK